jgi:hypothetical protein
MVADAVPSKACAIIPVAPVNPSVSASPPLEPTPSVVNHVNRAPRDWTLKKPAAEPVQEPPKKPISQVLMDNLKSIWTASASAVQVQQNGNQIAQPTPPEPAQVPGDLAKQVLTYQPSKIKKNEKL